MNGPGLALLTGAVRLLSAGIVTTAGALALLGVLSLAVLPWAVAALSRELGSTRLAAGIHGVLALLVSFYAGGGLAGLYGTGLLAHNIALPLVLVALVLLRRAATGPGRRHVAVAALVVAVIGLLHPISILVLGGFSPLVMALLRRRPRTGPGPRQVATRLASAGGLAAGLVAFWAVPAVLGRHLQGDATGWGIPSLPARLGEIWQGEVLTSRLVAVAATGALLATALGAISRPELRRRLDGPAVAVAYLAVAHLVVARGWGPYDLAIQLPTRGLAVAGILLLQPLACLTADGMAAAGSRLPRSLPVSAVGGAAAVAVPALGPWLLPGHLSPAQTAPAPAPAFAQAAVQLSSRVPPMGRHLLIRPDHADLGTDQPSRWLAAASGTNSAHLYLWEATRENAAGIVARDLFRQRQPAAALPLLRRLGVTHVVAAVPEQTAVLDALSGFARVWTGGRVTIFEVRPAPGDPSPRALLQPASDGGKDAGLAAVPVVRRPEHLSWEVDARRTVTAVAAVAHHPGWTATVDGVEIDVDRSGDGLAEVEIPPGRHDLSLRFSAATPTRRGATAASLLAAALAGWVILGCPTNRRQPAQALDGEGGVP